MVHVSAPAPASFSCLAGAKQGYRTLAFILQRGRTLVSLVPSSGPPPPALVVQLVSPVAVLMSIEPLLIPAEETSIK